MLVLSLEKKGCHLVITLWEPSDRSSFQQVVELDPVVLNLARNFFGFTEDKCLKVVHYILISYFSYFHYF